MEPNAVHNWRSVSWNALPPGQWVRLSRDGQLLGCGVVDGTTPDGSIIWVVFAFFAFVLWALTTQPDTLLALLVTPVWFLILGVAWLVLRRRPAHLARFEVFQAELRADQAAAGRPAGQDSGPAAHEVEQARK